MIYSIDKYKYKTSPENLFSIISDFNNYYLWWPRFIRFQNIDVNADIVGSNIEVKPFLSPCFRWKVENFIENEILEIKYESGAYIGTGIWEINDVTDYVELSYEVKLQINNLIIKFISSLISIEFLHKKLMYRVFKNLENKLKLS